MQIAKNDFAGAKRTAILAGDGFRALGDATGESAALAIVGDVYRRTGKLDSAARAYRMGLRRLGSRRASGVEWRLHSGFGETLHRANDLAGAAGELRKAIAVSEAAASGVRLEERRAGLNSDKWIAYRELALVELARGKPADAFSLSEKLRARQMVDLVSRGRISFGDASAREQDMRRRIAVLTKELESDASSFQRVREPRLESRPVATVRAELDKAQREYAAELARVREKDPSYARFVSGSTRSWKEIASRLGRDQVLIEYLLTDSASFAFVVTRDTVAAIDLRTDHDKIANLVEFARRTVEKPSRSGGGKLWQVPLRKLYATLIEPIEARGYLRGKTSLLIAPHSELHFLSFASLMQPQTDHFLVDRYDISYTPSATVWAQLKDRPARALPAGVLALAPNIQRLPATKDEVGAISRIYGRRVVVKTGRDATSQALRSGLANAGTIHLATFGVLNKHNPLFSFIELAPDSKSDGHLDVSEVFGLPMSGQLVVLSACQTAVGSGSLADVPPGDDWVSLVQAFLQAGASTVVASLWPVEDRATADLMTRFHQARAQGASSSAAIARAQRAAIRTARTSDPFYWAAFAASGKSD
jgi:CHAT domain-containing protein